MSNDFLTIYRAYSRTDTTLEPLSTSWADFVNTCSRPRPTRETLARYAAMTKAQRGKVKDVGGFVGGRLRNGIRRKDAVEDRCILTLDLDNATADAWERISAALPRTALFVYSTHSHTEDAPRLRLVVLLSRPVRPDVYVILARAVMERVGAEMFDTTCDQPERLMYWPSHCRDAVYYFREQKGTGLPVDFAEAAQSPESGQNRTQCAIAPADADLSTFPKLLS